MKKKLFLFVSACVFMSCSSQDEVFNQNETTSQKNQALSDDSQNQILLNDQQSELTLRNLGMKEPYETMTNQFFDSNNQKLIYEYLAYSGSIHTDQYVIDAYYSDENKGPSFYDQLSGHTFIFKGTLGKIGRSIPSTSHEARTLFTGLFLVYMSDMNCHKMCIIDIIDRHIYPGQLVKDLGFTIHLPVYLLADKSKFTNGEWGVIRQCYSSSRDSYRTFSSRYDVERPGLPIWNGGQNDLGDIVLY